jgi:crotonobetainyl-CoA:carnitine CoA-transferase CaiB-like acyl-CoA transferase
VADLLAGIKVIDAANFIAGPVSATVMADFGADVVKVEPPTGDIYRVRGAGYPASAYNFPWIVDNRSKRSVAIDLRTKDGQALLHRLVADADVFITNAPLDSRERLGTKRCRPSTRGWSTPRSPPTARRARKPASPASTASRSGPAPG